MGGAGPAEGPKDLPASAALWNAPPLGRRFSVRSGVNQPTTGALAEATKPHFLTPWPSVSSFEAAGLLAELFQGFRRVPIKTRHSSLTGVDRAAVMRF